MGYTDLSLLRVAGIPVFGGGAQHDISGPVYFCDGNANASGSGENWDEAYNSLTSTLAVSDAAQRLSSNRWWARRSTIFMCADLMDEDLTKLSEKTDVIGVGSMNQYKKAGIIGTHSIEAAATAHYMGCRLINLHFRDDGATVNFTLPADQNGIEFLGCDFQRNASGTGAIASTSNHDLKIIECNFYPDTSNGKFTTAISLGNGIATNVLIKDNFINAGICMAFHATPSFANCRVDNNTLFATTLCVDDNSDDWYVVNNTCVSLAAATGASTWEELLDINLALASNNSITGSNVVSAPYPVLDATT
jgi:hypothetical protein